MTIIQRYIAKHVMLATVLVFLVVLVLSFVIDLLGELRDIGVGDYGFLQAVVHVIFLLPNTVYQFFPMLILLGGVLGLGMLAANYELIVMRTAGLSTAKIIKAVLMAALILIVIATLLGEFVAPRADLFGEQYKSIAQSGGQAVATTSGVWIHENNNFLHIDNVLNKNHLEGVSRYEFDNQHRLIAAYNAKSLDYVHGQWVIHDLVKTTIKNDKTVSEQFPIATWNLKLTPNYLSVGLVEPQSMTLKKLADYSLYLRHNHLQASSFQLEFWKRIFQPLTTLVMILLAIPFVFVAPRSMSMGKRILFGIFIGFVFYILNTFVGQFSIVFQFPPVLAALIPTMIFALVGWGLMWRVRG